MKRLFYLSILLTSLFVLPLTSPAYAQCGGITLPGGFIVWSGMTNCAFYTPGGIISSFLQPILVILGFITVIMIVLSGIQFITSGGNPEAAAGARNRLTYALVGFIVIILAFSILQIVDRIFLVSGAV